MTKEGRVTMQFKAESFNVLNQFNPGNPNTSLTLNHNNGANTNANFGTITGVIEKASPERGVVASARPQERQVTNWRKYSKFDSSPQAGYLQGKTIKQSQYPTTMTSKITAAAARTQFGELIDRAVDNDERFLVERNGEPAVLILSVTDFVKTLAPAPEWLKDIQNHARRQGLDKLTMDDIDAEIAATRSDRRERQRQSGT